LRLLYAGIELPSEAISDYTPTKEERNAEIYQRYLAGERAVDLAREYGMSLQRIYKIIRNQKKQG
jgi:Mor family transcriptional regulator